MVLDLSPRQEGDPPTRGATFAKYLLPLGLGYLTFHFPALSVVSVPMT